MKTITIVFSTLIIASSTFIFLKQSDDKITIVKNNELTKTQNIQTTVDSFELQSTKNITLSENTELTPKKIITQIQIKKNDALITTPQVDVAVLHENEIKDSDWADEVEQKLMTLFTEDNIGIQMQSLDCRTTLCKIYLSDADGEDLKLIRRKIADNVSSIVGNLELKMFDNDSVVIYLTKEIISEGYVHPEPPEPVIMSMMPTSASSSKLP